MGIVQKDVYVTQDGKEFIDRIEAIQHERSRQAADEIEQLLFGGRAMQSLRKIWGDDVGLEFAANLAFWMAKRPTSTKLLKILRQLEEGIPATGPNPEGQNVKT